MAAAFLFPALAARLTDPATGAVDYAALFMVPTALALAAVVLLAVFFRPPSRAGRLFEDAGPARRCATTP